MDDNRVADNSEPTTRQELLDSLRSLHMRSTRFWDGLSNDYFFTPTGEKWSPAENVQHLNKSTRPVVLAMRLPRFVPRLLFGVCKRPSRSYSQIRTTYQAALDKGGQAGSYAPKRREFPDNPEKVREKIMLDWSSIWQQLIRATDRLDDRSLDQLQLPHPLIGKLSYREMLYFTLYHHLHHLEIVARRLNDASQLPRQSR